MIFLPDVVTWSTAITACEKGQQWEGAFALLQEMGHQLLTPDAVSWNAAISACEMGKQWERALALLQRWFTSC